MFVYPDPLSPSVWLFVCVSPGKQPRTSLHLYHLWSECLPISRPTSSRADIQAQNLTPNAAPNAAQNHDHGPIISELLCFVMNKSSTMPFDMLVKLCTDFYSEDDVECANDILFNSVYAEQHESTPHNKTSRYHKEVT